MASLPPDPSRPPASNEFDEVIARKGSFLQTLKAVAWSFFGVRKGAGYQQDISRLNPVHVIIAGLIAAALFVGLLVVAANWIVKSGVAA